MINGLIARWAAYTSKVDAAAQQSVPVVNVKLRPPLPTPATIVCMAVNYLEDDTRTEPAPIHAFLKSPSAIIGQDDTTVLPELPSTILEGEAVVARVIGKRCSKAPAASAIELPELHRRLGARPAAVGQHVLPDEVARHVRADRPVHRHGRRDHRGLSGCQHGGCIELETQGLGNLRFSARDALTRPWSRETRLDRPHKNLEPPPQLPGKYPPVPK